MRYREFGAKNRETILLLHGGGLSWWNFREEAALLEGDYRVILPILDGHAGSDRPFTTIEDNAAEILAFIDEELGESVALIGGLSLGAQVLLEMLSQRAELCACARVESAAAIPDRLTHALIAPAVGSSYGLIRDRSFARLQAKSLHIREELFEDYYRDTCQIRKEDMIAFLRASTAYAPKESLRDARAEIHVYYGLRETGQIRSSAERLRQLRSDCALHPLPGLYHGGFSLDRAEDYAREVRRLLGCAR